MVVSLQLQLEQVVDQFRFEYLKALLLQLDCQTSQITTVMATQAVDPFTVAILQVTDLFTVIASWVTVPFTAADTTVAAVGSTTKFVVTIARQL